MTAVTDARTDWLRAIRGFDRNAYLLFFAAGVLGFSYIGITSLLTNLFVSRLGYGTEVVGNLNALFFMLHMAFSVPAGALGMRLGSRNAMLLGGLLAFAGWAVAPVATFLLYPGARMSVLVTSRVISSLGGALFIVNANPALMQAVEPASSTYAFAFNAMVVSLMTFLGNLFGGILPTFLLGNALFSSARPFGYALWIGVLVLVPGLVAIGVFRETGRGTPPVSNAIAQRAPIAILAVIAAVRFLRECGFGGVANFFNIYLDSTMRLPTALIGLLISVSSIASILFTPLMPMVARRWGTGRTSFASLVVMGFSVVVIALSTSWLPAAIGWAGMTAANSINEAAMQVYILGIVAPQWRALMSGAANMATTLGLAISASAGGYLVGRAGYQALFGISAGFIFASSAAFLGHLLARRVRGRALA
jgi:MFS family permease